MDIGAQLYTQFLKGDTAALEKLVEMYSDGLVRFAYCFVCDTAAAEDVMEDTFAAIVASRRWFSPKAQFKTYLYRIARNKCIDYIRFNKRFVPLKDLDDVSFDDVQEDLEQRERKRALYRCLQQLPEQYRHALQLQLEGFEVREMCSILKRNAKQVYNLLARAKTELKNLLIQEGIEE